MSKLSSTVSVFKTRLSDPTISVKRETTSTNEKKTLIVLKFLTMYSVRRVSRSKIFVTFVSGDHRSYEGTDPSKYTLSVWVSHELVLVWLLHRPVGHGPVLTGPFSCRGGQSFRKRPVIGHPCWILESVFPGFRDTKMGRQRNEQWRRNDPVLFLGDTWWDWESDIRDLDEVSEGRRRKERVETFDSREERWKSQNRLNNRRKKPTVCSTCDHCDSEIRIQGHRSLNNDIYRLGFQETFVR